MTFKDKLKLITEAIQAARESSLDLETINLYITKANGLEDFDPNEIYDILHKIEVQDKVLSIEDVPTFVASHAGFPPEDFLSGQTSFILKLLNGFDKWSSKVSPEVHSSYFFDKDKGLITINGEKILFKNEGKRIPYLDALVNSNEVNSDEYIYHDEIADELEGASKMKDPRIIYYELCRGIEARLIKSKVNDFLQFDTSRARINPKYKQATK